MNNKERMMICCCDAEEEQKLLDASAGAKNYALSTAIYGFDQEKNDLTYIGQRFIYAAMGHCDERSFSVEEFLNILRNGIDVPASAVPVFYVPEETFTAYKEKKSDSYTALMIPPCYRTHAQSVEQDHDRRMNTICRENKRILLFDMQCFPDESIPGDLPEPGRNRPDLCIGTDPVLTPPWLTEIIRSRFEEAGFSVAINAPYSGCYVPESIHSGESTCECLPVRLGFSTRTYMKTDVFLDDRKILKIRKVIRDIAAECVVCKSNCKEGRFSDTK